MYPPPARYSTACSITPRLSRSTGAATDSSQPPSSHQAKSNQDNSLKTSKTEPKAAQGYQLFWFLLRIGNRVNRLAASHEHYALPVQVRIRHKRCPLRATPIYSVSTLSWLRSALKRLPSFALDSCSLVTSLSGLKRKNLLLPTPSINCESVEIRFVTLDLPRNP